MKKQTAVEWLVEHILSEVDKYNDDCTKVVGVEYWNAFRSCTDLSEYVDKAKQMEREQIIEAAKYGNSFEQGDLRCEVYYNETYSK
jgi:hypothetical protein